MKLLGQITELIELFPDSIHLIAVHRPEHLDQHGNRLLKLVQHLLLHHAELIHQGYQHRLGKFSSLQPHWFILIW